MLSRLARRRSGRRYRETPLSSHGVMTAAADRARATSSANDRKGEFQRRLYHLLTEVSRWPFADGFNRGDPGVRSRGLPAAGPASRITRKNVLFARCAEMGNHRHLLQIAKFNDVGTGL